MRYFLALLAAWMTFSVHAEIHKWVDADGRTHFGEKPPANLASERLDKPAETSGKALPEPDSDEQAKINKISNDLAQSIVRENSKDYRDPNEKPMLDCDKAVFNAKGGIDFMLDVGKQNADAGYIDKAKYEKINGVLSQSKNRISITECETSTGEVKGFYECVMETNNHVAMCAEKYRYWDVVLLGKS